MLLHGWVPHNCILNIKFIPIGCDCVTSHCVDRKIAYLWKCHRLWKCY